MAWIRIGRFDDFKGSDTLLIDWDRAGLGTLIELIRSVATAPTSLDIGRRSGGIAYGGLILFAENSLSDPGLVAASGHEFRWRRSPEGWEDVVDRLLALQAEADGHQYFDGVAGTPQLMISIGEYGEEWWANHAG
jgi:hypothetical protein